ncbi:hypothetical protein FA95DRAFT_1556793 [Auriscalpium vulgare]|uniref:Uncharacterized protein n=1 Tax=Auriscalpium vulgare TaxID=40419 RepID=A0ACB8S057_9AGAM|nr:hypothetical protein FA95DRAFT_1556793 [Auriscalpium vulgare]
MVCADNLNFDVLEIIFSHLSVPDLASVSQVSRSFLAGANPRLYRSLGFYLSHAKRYPRVMSPFATLKTHARLATHVRNVDICVIPILRSGVRQFPEPNFMRDCANAITLSTNLISFTCLIATALPAFLIALQEPHERLRTMRISAHLTTEQTAKLVQLRGLRNLTLENASWAVLDALPKWAEAMKETLAHLTISSSPDLNDAVLKQTIAHLPKLRSLHIVQCQHVSHFDVLSATEQTPALESLALTVTDSRQLPTASLSALKHLALDLPQSALPSPSPSLYNTPSLMSSMLALTRFTRLKSLALRLPMQPLPDDIVDDILQMHGTTLRSLRFMGCKVSMQSVESIAEVCEGLDRLVMSVPVSEMEAFSACLSGTSSLKTLVDVHDHNAHGPRQSLTTEPVRQLIDDVPSLTRVVSSNRCWTSRIVDDEPEVKLERVRSSWRSGRWFLPPPEAEMSSD